MLAACVFIIIGLGILVYGADIFVVGASGVARQLGMPPLVIGLTIVGFATSAPEIIVGSVSAWQDKTAIAIGNAIGSNITNTGMVLGMSVLLLPITVASDTVRREYALMLVSIILAFVLMLDGSLSRLDGSILLVALFIFITCIVWIAKRTSEDDPLNAESTREYSETDPLGKAGIRLLVGLALLLLGAELLVRGAVTIAGFFGVSDLIIGLTVVAIGTSLPELAASIASLIKKEADIAIGNIIGSNMFNMLAVLGLPVLIKPASFEKDVLLRDMPVMMGITMLLGLMLFISSKGRLARIEGALLLLCFMAYQYVLFSKSIL